MTEEGGISRRVGTKKELSSCIKNNKSRLLTSLGEITLHSIIGEGGNGVVYEGCLHSITVAIKFLVGVTQLEKITRFKSEYLNLKLIPKNDFVVSLLNYDEIHFENIFFPIIIMEKCDSALKSNFPNNSKEEFRDLFNFLLGSLKFIHSNGIVHRDLKPENILKKGAGYVLADFGIAHFSKAQFSAKTKPGTRLANFQFSAPEQSGSKAQMVSPAPTMDLYAFGQICQWFVTGSTHRGIGREPLSNRFPGEEIIDAVVNKCLFNNPAMRFQSVQEIESFIQSKTHDPWDILRDFGDALGESFPRGLDSASSSSDPQIIKNLLNNITKKQLETYLWYSQGSANSPTSFFDLGNNIWLMGNLEISIEKVYAYFDNSLYKDFVVLVTKPMPTFGIYPNPNSSYEEAGYVDSTYITRGEWDNGWAVINGKTVKIDRERSSLRCRSMKKELFFIGTMFNSCIEMQNDKYVSSVCKLYKKNWIVGNEKIFEKLAKKIGRIRHPDIEYGI